MGEGLHVVIVSGGYGLVRGGVPTDAWGGAGHPRHLAVEHQDTHRIGLRAPRIAGRSRERYVELRSGKGVSAMRVDGDFEPTVR
jgi:hypothetical protein